MTQTPTTEQKIAARFATLIASGMTVPQAFDAVLGAGTYAALASDVYDTLRAQAEGR